MARTPVKSKNKRRGNESSGTESVCTVQKFPVFGSVRMPEIFPRNGPFFKKNAHFPVKRVLDNRPMNGSEAAGELVLIQTLLFLS